MTRKEFYSKYPMVSGADLDSLIDWVNAPKSEMAGVVLGKIADMCYVSVADIKDKSRLREIADARFLFCRYAKDELSMGLRDIGSMINRHHASVIHAVKESKKVPQLVKKNAELVGAVGGCAVFDRGVELIEPTDAEIKAEAKRRAAHHQMLEGATVKGPLTAEKNSNELFYVCEKIENKVAVWWTGSVYMAEGDPPMWTQNIDNAFRSGSHKEIEGLIALYSLDGYVSEHMYMTLQDNYASSRTVVPSDEEIERAFPVSSPIKALSVSYIEKQLARIEGARWMRKLIEERSSK